MSKTATKTLKKADIERENQDLRALLQSEENNRLALVEHVNTLESEIVARDEKLDFCHSMIETLEKTMDGLVRENVEIFETRNILIGDVEDLNGRIRDLEDWGIYVVRVLQAIQAYRGGDPIYPRNLAETILHEINGEEEVTADGV